MTTLFLLGFWVALSSIVGIAASTRGRDGGGWFVLALIISPLIAGLLVLALPKLNSAKPGLSYSLNPSQARPARGQMVAQGRTCPACESVMSATAAVCATCLRESTPMTKTEVYQMNEKARKTQQSDNLIRVGVFFGIVIILVLKAMS